MDSLTSSDCTEILLSGQWDQIFCQISSTNSLSQRAYFIYITLSDSSLKSFSNAIISSVGDFELVDIWQILLPFLTVFEEKEYTSNKGVKQYNLEGIQQSNQKIKYFYHLVNYVQLIQYQMSKHFKSNLRHWLGKVYNLCKKPKKIVCDIAKKMIQMQPKQTKNITEERIVDNLFDSFEQLKAIDSSIEEGMSLIDKFISDYQLTINQKLRESIMQYIQKYFSRAEQNTRNYQQLVSNIWNKDTQSYDCICPKTTKDLQFSQLKQVCYRCKRICHVNCFWGKDYKQQSYECPMCFLMNCLPNKEIKKILFAGFLRQMKKDKIQYKINLPLQNALNQQQQVQARCVRLSKDSKYQLAWPVSCTLTLNNKKIIDLRPLNTNCSLKKRTDDQVNLQRKLLSSNNNLVIEQRHQYVEGCRPAVYQNHLVVVVIMKPVSSTQIVKRVMNQKLNPQQSKEILSKHFDRGIQDSIIVDRIKVALKCQLYNSKIKIPVRSKHCTTHYQPFDLKGFLMANINIRSSSQRWKCPICKQRAYHLVVDSYLLNLVLKNPKITEVQFDRKGQATVIEEQDSSDNQSKDYQIIQCQNQQVTPAKEIQNNQVVSRNQFVEFIQIQSDIEDQVNQEENHKRAFSQRKLDHKTDQFKIKQPKKKLKNDNIENNQKNPFHFINVKQSVEDQSDRISQESIQSLSNIRSVQSKYSPNQSYFKPQKGKKHNKRQKSLEEGKKREFDKMAKTLIPSPAITTVIPQAIRILQKKMPDIPKNNSNIQVIDLSEEEDNEPIQSRNSKKLLYHKQQLLREKKLVSNTFGKIANFQISSSDQGIFLSICNQFLNAPYQKYMK